jgi:hypothetical protein
LLFLDASACSPELNPKENVWDEIPEKIMDAMRAKLKRAILYIERNPKFSSAPSSLSLSPISSTHSDVELVSDCQFSKP